jgi:RNA polymerase sigma-70 factor (ECF subfamily)
VDLKRLLSGDSDAWRDFVATYSGNVYSVILRILQGRSGKADPGMVDDLVADTFFRIVRDDFRLLRTYRPEKSPMHFWIGMVARSTAINVLRKKQLPLIPLEDVLVQPPSEDGADGAIDIPPDVLSPQQALILRLMFNDGMDAAEVGEILRLDPTSVRTAKFKAIKKLREYAEKNETKRKVRGNAPPEE